MEREAKQLRKSKESDQKSFNYFQHQKAQMSKNSLRSKASLKTLQSKSSTQFKSFQNTSMEPSRPDLGILEDETVGASNEPERPLLGYNYARYHHEGVICARTAESAYKLAKMRQRVQKSKLMRPLTALVGKKKK